MRSTLLLSFFLLLGFISFNSEASITKASFLANSDTLRTLPISGSPFCGGSTLQVPFSTKVVFPADNIFTVQLSSNTGSFSSPRVLGSAPGTGSGTIQVTIPTNQVAGTAYRIRVVASKPTTGMIIENNGQNLTIYPLPPTPTITSNTGVCAGGTLTISASSISNATYTWTGPNGFTATGRTITRKGAEVDASGTYTVTANVNGCISTASAEIVVRPALANAGPDRIICYGQSVRLEATGGVKYSWSPSATLNDASIANPIATPTATTTYTVTVTGENGCRRTDQILVTVSPLPVLTVTPAIPAICLGSSVQLQATGAVTYSWSPATGLSDPTIANPIASPTATTIYTVTGTSAAGCVTSKTVTVKVNPIPVANAGLDKVVCSRQATVLGTPAVSGNTYSWSPAIGLSRTNIANPTLNYPGDNTEPITVEYTLTVTSNGCTSTDVVKVTVNPAAYAGPDMTICAGGAAQLQASGGLTYSWSPATGLSNPSIANPIANPAVTTNYTVTITNPNGTCAKTDQVKVTVNPLPVVTATASIASICAGGSSRLTATGGTSYQWTPALGLDNPNSATPVASPTATTTYTVTATNAKGCTQTAQVTVTVNPLPSPVIQASGSTDLCPGGSVTLTSSPASTYLWSTGETTPSITVNTAGSYTVTVTNENNCSAISNPTSVTVLPVTTVSLTPFANICKDRSMFALTGGSPAGGTYSGPGVSNNQFNTAEAGQGTHTITYTYTNAQGCMASATQTIMVGNCLSVTDDLQAASLKAYPSPVHDELTVTVTLVKKEEVTLFLTDLKGQIIYRSSSTVLPGEFKKNISVKDLPDGMYLLQYRTAGASSSKKVVIAH
ncbi:T9SS C-terminal target domain-containing protein [Rufibacter latericius]|uniref:T9SS C-terminal target domain-containing protein n=2 Tax=Rufibacter latericius TaxID=2487040 RepID=A0A3M9MDB1_9BACT|nr:T9SS C-terminal target domain-containing protein [Rufibacter latericius]